MMPDTESQAANTRPASAAGVTKVNMAPLTVANALLLLVYIGVDLKMNRIV